MFKKGQTYDFNLTIDGTTYGIKCMFTGFGETDANGVDIGYFQRVKAGGEQGHIFKWTKEKAVALQPKVWDEERAEF